MPLAAPTLSLPSGTPSSWVWPGHVSPLRLHAARVNAICAMGDRDRAGRRRTCDHATPGLTSPWLAVFDGASAVTTMVGPCLNPLPGQQGVDVVTRLRAKARAYHPAAANRIPAGSDPVRIGYGDDGWPPTNIMRNRHALERRSIGCLRLDARDPFRGSPFPVGHQRLAAPGACLPVRS
jgi:hypothetical protein